MRFYDMLQLDAAVLKSKIREAETESERRRIWIAMALRSLLIVSFAILCIAPVGSVFGTENVPMGVALFCIFLGIRFVDFGYCIKDSMISLACCFSILLIAPVVTALVHPIFAACIHFAAFFAIMLMACEKPEMGNGGLYGFAYVFLAGNPVTGMMFWKRAALTLIGYLICGTILYVKHRNKNQEIRFLEVIRQFNLSQEKNRWQLRMALGMSLVLALGALFRLERFIWMGFACASILSCYPYSANFKERAWHRVLGVVIGSALFFVVDLIVPQSMHSLFGPLGGLCLGFSTKYHHKTVLNCFGALVTAAGLYGTHGAVLLRIQNNILGIVFGFVFIFLYQKLVDKRFELCPVNVQEPTTDLE